MFNFTLMQEYVAAIVGVPVGKYYHKADNLHVYKDFIPLAEEIAKRDPNSYPSHFICVSCPFTEKETMP